MLFNSLQYVFFLGALFLLHQATPHRWRWAPLLVASYVFYASWNLKYTALILFTTLSSYTGALGIERTAAKRRRQILLGAVVAINLAVLIVFKYVDFLIDSLNRFFVSVQTGGPLEPMDFLLPVGISFYTFQALGYAVDVYRKDTPAERHFGFYALYVSFFPQLVAGPIERSRNLLPQLRQRMALSHARFSSGLTLILLGYFKKLVIADRLAVYVDAIYGRQQATPLEWAVATLFFSFQIYCDFSGYTNIAIGSARLLGIDLMRNFQRPYLAASVRDFWRRWHISLSTWFRDYLYIPLGGNRVSPGRLMLNLLAVFALCGLWHGAAWTFVAWGGLHGVMLCAGNLPRILRPGTAPHRAWSSPLVKAAKILGVFVLVTLAWVLFRAQDMGQALDIYASLASLPLNPGELTFNATFGLLDFNHCLAFIALLMGFECLMETGRFDMAAHEGSLRKQFAAQYVLLMLVLLFGTYTSNEFIYFQF